MKLFLCLIFFHLSCVEKEFVVLGTRHDGMFSMFYDVVLAMKIYEKGLYAGVEIDFGYPKENAIYLDEEHGPNWWNYYFEPIRYGDVSAPKRYVVGYLPFGVPWNLDSESLGERRNAYRLIKKYIRIRSHILDKVDAFMKSHFQGKFLVAVHYRGTDKKESSPPYMKVWFEIEKELLRRGLSEYQIFVATDSQSFLDFMIQKYEDKVCFCEENTRSFDGTAIHLNPFTDKYRIGEEALIDCLLLSKADILIRTDSNLSYCSTFFNPDIFEIFVN